MQDRKRAGVEPSERDELITAIAVINDSTKRIEKALMGNGREGLIAQTARLEERMAGISIEITAIKASVPSRKAKVALGGSVSLAMIVAFLNQIKEVLGAMKQ
jgi:hypothetical protein